MNLNFDYSNAFVKNEEVENMKGFIEHAHMMTHSKTGPGNEFLGWVDLPSRISPEEVEDIKNTAQYIRENSQVFIVIGIGGSYLGAKAALEALNHSFYNEVGGNEKNPKIYYLGQNISSSYIIDLLDAIGNKDLMVNIISKSGTTTEPAIAFRIIKEFMENKYGDEASKRIIATTDKERGALKELSNKMGYKTFVIPDDVGGRYSMFTPVGLLPMAVSGINIEKIIEGAKSGEEEYSKSSLEDNIAYQYAAIRNIMYNRGKTIEILANYEPSLIYLSEWWKQLYGESEGKNNKGIFPASVNFTTDLHSMGQYIQDGRRDLFETVILIKNPKNDLELKETKDDLDGLNYLSGKTLDYINKKAAEGTRQAHISGGVPNLIIELPYLDEFYFAKMIYFFEKACGISGYILGVNPFDQPGVEEYKKNMFKLLEKPGY